MRVVVPTFALLLISCGGSSAADGGVDAAPADAGPVDAGTAAGADGGVDGGPDAGCDVLAWDMGAVFSLGSPCGVGPDEGSRLCFELTVDGLGAVSSIAEGPSSDITLDATVLECLAAEVEGRCVPRLAGQPPDEQCAFGL